MNPASRSKRRVYIRLIALLAVATGVVLSYRSDVRETVGSGSTRSDTASKNGQSSTGVWDRAIGRVLPVLKQIAPWEATRKDSPVLGKGYVPASEVRPPPPPPLPPPTPPREPPDPASHPLLMENPGGVNGDRPERNPVPHR